MSRDSIMISQNTLAPLGFETEGGSDARSKDTCSSDQNTQQLGKGTSDSRVLAANLFEKMRLHFKTDYQCKVMVFLDCLQRYELGLLDQSAYVAFLQCFFNESPQLYKELYACTYHTEYLQETTASRVNSTEDSDSDAGSIDGNNAGNAGGVDRSQTESMDVQDYRDTASTSSSNKPKRARTSSSKLNIPSHVSNEDITSLRSDVQAFLHDVLQFMGPVGYEHILDDFTELRKFHRLGYTHYYAQSLTNIRHKLTTDQSLTSQMESLFPVTPSPPYPVIHSANERFMPATHFGLDGPSGLESMNSNMSNSNNRNSNSTGANLFSSSSSSAYYPPPSSHNYSFQSSVLSSSSRDHQYSPTGVTSGKKPLVPPRTVSVGVGVGSNSVGRSTKSSSSSNSSTTAVEQQLPNASSVVDSIFRQNQSAGEPLEREPSHPQPWWVAHSAQMRQQQQQQQSSSSSYMRPDTTAGPSRFGGVDSPDSPSSPSSASHHPSASSSSSYPMYSSVPQPHHPHQQQQSYYHHHHHQYPLHHHTTAPGAALYNNSPLVSSTAAPLPPPLLHLPSPTSSLPPRPVVFSLVPVDEEDSIWNELSVPGLAFNNHSNNSNHSNNNFSTQQK